MKLFLRILLIVVLLILASFSGYQFILLQSLTSDIAQIRETLNLPSQSGFRNVSEETKVVNAECDESCKLSISQEVASAVSKITISPVVTVTSEKTPTTPSTQKLVSYVPMGTTASTTNTDWTTVEDSTVVLDLENDYSKSATVSWDASLRIPDGSGTAYARLYDATHTIAVDQSEIKTDNNQSFLQVTSKNLPFWKGRNTYKIQIKSLSGSQVVISSARLKIQY